MGEAELFGQALEALGFFQRVEVFALDVLDEAIAAAASSGTALSEDGHLTQAGELGGAAAAFAGNDFVAALVAHRATRQGWAA